MPGLCINLGEELKVKIGGKRNGRAESNKACGKVPEYLTEEDHQ